MSKKTLNLSIEEPIKRRAKRIAKQRGLSVSQIFENFIAEQEDENVFTPTPGTAAYSLSRLIPESEKSVSPDYDKMKDEALKEKYDLD